MPEAAETERQLREKLERLIGETLNRMLESGEIEPGWRLCSAVHARPSMLLINRQYRAIPRIGYPPECARALDATPVERLAGD